MIEVRGLLRRHDHIVPCLRGRDPALLATPAHHSRAGRDTALKYFVPAHEAPPTLREPRIEVADEPRLQLVFVFQPFLLHALLRGRGVPPLGLRAFVTADVDELRREELEYLVEDVFEKAKHVVRDAEDVVGDAPVRQDFDRLASVPELRVCRDRGHRVPGHLDLRQHTDPTLRGVPHDLPHVVLRVETAVRFARKFASRRVLRSWRGHRILAERADGGELRVLLDLDAPALVLGEMPVEDVELVQREEIDVLEDEFLRHEMAAHVEMAPAPGEARPILDLKRRYRPGRSGDRGAPVNVGREELAQCLRAVAYPGRFGSADRDLVSGDGEAVALFADTPEGGAEGERDTRPRSGAHAERPAGRGTELIAKELGGNAHVIARRDRCRRAERERARSGRELRRNGNQGRGGHQRPSYRLRALPRAVDADDRLTERGDLVRPGRRPPRAGSRRPRSSSRPTRRAVHRRSPLRRGSG